MKFRCHLSRSVGYLWLIITVGPIALTIDLIKAEITEMPTLREHEENSLRIICNARSAQSQTMQLVPDQLLITSGLEHEMAGMAWNGWESDVIPFRLDKEQSEAPAAGCFNNMLILPCPSAT